MAASFVRITASSREHLLALQQFPELDLFRHTARQLEDGVYTVDGLLSREQIDQLLVEGYTIEVVADADKIAMERSRELNIRMSQPADNAVD
jgi:hypothetical protein